MNGCVLLARTAAADMYPPEKRARAISYVLFGALFGAALGPLVFRPLFAGKDLELDTLVIPWFAAAGDRPRRRSPRAHDPARPAHDRAGAPRRRTGRRRAGPVRSSGVGAGDPPPARRALRGHRGARQLRGHGRGDEPDRLHRRRPRPRAGRRLHRDQPPHRRHVRARPRHRSAHRPGGTAPLARDGARRHGGVHDHARVGGVDPVDLRLALPARPRLERVLRRGDCRARLARDARRARSPHRRHRSRGRAARRGPRPARRRRLLGVGSRRGRRRRDRRRRGAGARDPARPTTAGPCRRSSQPGSQPKERGAVSGASVCFVVAFGAT